MAYRNPILSFGFPFHGSTHSTYPYLLPWQPFQSSRGVQIAIFQRLPFIGLNRRRHMKLYFSKRWNSLGLCFLICFAGLPAKSLAQTPLNLPARIEVIIVEGEGATSKVRERSSADPVVRIEDDDHRPVAEASVVFALPISGTSGEFTNGAKTLMVMTDKDGRAAAHGLRTNEIPGKLQIYVTASYHGLRARTLINQIVEAVPGAKIPAPDLRTSKSGGKWKWVVLGLAAAGGTGAGVYFGTHSTSSTSPISIGVGTVSFGSPR